MQNKKDTLSLMEGEELIIRLGGLSLTNKRLLYYAAIQKATETGVAMLKDIDSAAIRRNKPSIALLIIGCILEILGIMTLRAYAQLGLGYSFFLIIIGAIMVALFFSLKEKIIRITVNGGEWLNVSLRQVGSEEAVMDFINKLFEIKDKIDNSRASEKQGKPSSLYDFE